MEIRDYIAPILKWWWLIALSTMIAGGASFFATRQQPLKYQSSATLAVGSALEQLNPSGSDLFLTQQLASFYVDMSGRTSVRQDTMDALGLEWLPEIYVQSVDNLIDIIVIDTDPQRAQAVAAELTRQIILRSPSGQQRDIDRQAFINRQLDNYQTAIMEGQAAIEEKQKELSTLTSAREISLLQVEINELAGSLYDLETNYADLLSSTQQGATNAISVIEPATFPSWPIESSNTITVVMAAAIGLVLAGSAAYILEYLDNSIGTTERLSKVTSLPVLAGIAELKEDDSKLITIAKPLSPTAEAYRMVRTAVQFSNVEDDREIKSLLVVSATPGEGKSTTASNLSVVLAQAGYNVLLIDADLRRPTQHQIFEMSNKRGLTSMLLQMNSRNSDEEIFKLIEDTIQAAPAERLNLLTCGPIPPNPAELLGSAKMLRLLKLVDDRFDFVILDSPPLLSVSEGLILSRRVDGVILVARTSARRNQINQAVVKLKEINANLIGSVLNSVKTRSAGYSTLQYYREPYEADLSDHLDAEDDGEEGQSANGEARTKIASSRIAGLL
ncbi:MAG: hypothetical protein DWQ04_06770 [Chloroflexi bacterium]|nr:MAG: hypothetical protein DWQ04_06770 [Chloroflexota bacterium]